MSNSRWIRSNFTQTLVKWEILFFALIRALGFQNKFCFVFFGKQITHLKRIRLYVFLNAVFSNLHVKNAAIPWWKFLNLKKKTLENNTFIKDKHWFDKERVRVAQEVEFMRQDEFLLEINYRRGWKQCVCTQENTCQVSVATGLKVSPSSVKCCLSRAILAV